MHIQISWGEVDNSESLGKHVTHQVEHALRHWKARFTRVEVHLHDDNAGKGSGDDKRCIMEARPSGYSALIVEDCGSDLYQTVSTTAKKLERSARNFVGRLRDR